MKRDVQNLNVTIGKILRRERERSGLGLSLVAQKMSIPIEILEGYEEGRLGAPLPILLKLLTRYKSSIETIYEITSLSSSSFGSSI